MTHSPIFLVGMPGAGKSTLGRPLAQVLGRQFIDLDAYITSRYRMSIPEMFRRDGLEAFRRRESAMLREVADFCDVVVACGGGAPCYADNMALMLSHGIVVWLQAGDERLLERLSRRREHRPMIAAMSAPEIRQYIADTRREREPFYSQAHITHGGDRLECRPDIDATAQALAQKIIQHSLWTNPPL